MESFGFYSFLFIRFYILLRYRFYIWVFIFPDSTAFRLTLQLFMCFHGLFVTSLNLRRWDSDRYLLYMKGKRISWRENNSIFKVTYMPHLRKFYHILQVPGRWTSEHRSAQPDINWGYRCASPDCSCRINTSYRPTFRLWL